ncbi:MAG: PIN domain-containing protein [Akkermansiaceae bacterium]|nr:PIN domain-containing protein [Akkermansiaceae bacterium]
MPNAFVDSNILIYAADESTPADRKTRIAREVLRQRNLHLSVQVLSEFTVNARSKAKLNLSLEQEREWLNGWLLFPVAALTVETFLAATLIYARYQISHWDSLIIASAREARCDLVYSEDLNHGQDFDGVKVINPFV